MTFTYAIGTDRGKVRILAGDAGSAAYSFEDDEIDTFLAIETGIKRAAALALETLASNDAYQIKKGSLLEISYDGPAVSDALLKRAAKLREQADLEDAASIDGAFDIAEMVVNDATFEERVYKEGLRGG
jgi:hypothetical protein